MGKEVAQEFEPRRRISGASNAIGVHPGRMPSGCVDCQRNRPSDEVITTPLAFSPRQSIIRTVARPIFADVDAANFEYRSRFNRKRVKTIAVIEA